MRFLIIDDDDCKINRIKEYLRSHTVDIAKSRNEGLCKIVKSSFAYHGLILDMQFPICEDEWKIDREAGISVLKELKRKKIFISTIMYSSLYTNVSEFTNVIGYIINNGCDISKRIKSFIKDCEEYSERDIKQTEANKFYYEKMMKDMADYTLEVDINPIMISPQPIKDRVEGTLPGGNISIYPHNTIIRFDENDDKRIKERTDIFNDEIDKHIKILSRKDDE